jgi:sulfate transport system permease protein
VLVAVGYVGALLAAPAVTLVRGALVDGVGAFFSALARPDVVHALGLTAELAAIAVLVNTVFGVLVAWVLVRDRFFGRGVLNALVDVPFAVSPVVVGLVLLELFGRSGLLAPLADALDVKVAFALPGMAIATAFVSLPFVVREVAPVLEELGTDQELAAYTLGASAWTTFFRVTLPGIRLGLAYGVTLTAARAIGEFGAVLIVSGGVAGRTETATSFVYRALEDRDDVGAYAVAVVLALASVALLLAMKALERRRARPKRARAEDEIALDASERAAHAPALEREPKPAEAA